MKSESYILAMLKRAEQRKRRGIREDNDKMVYQSAYMVKYLKIILDIPKNTGRKRLQKDNKSMNKLLGIKK